jgi:curli production assembly/transport component CsgF
MKLLKIIIVPFLILFPLFLSAQEMVYTPVNPAFGGNTFNYQWLLSAANAQNTFEEESDFSFGEESDLDNFTESLNRQLLNKITSDLFREQFGDGDIQPGTYMFGSLVLEISPTSDGLLINILDTQTGDQTQIIIPN